MTRLLRLYRSGKCTTIRVPRPTSLSTSIRPPQPSTSRRTIASPSPDPLVVVEKRGSKIRGSSSGGIPAPSSITSSRPGPTVTSTTCAPAVPRVLEQVDHHLLHLVRARGAARTGLAREPHRAPLLRQPVELDDFADHDGQVDPVERLEVVGRRGEAAERARDRVEPVDLGQHPLGRVLERAVEVGAAVAVDPPEMLQAEAHRRERILDLVRHLARHLAPREHALGAGDVGDVVERDHDAPNVRSERRELEGDPPAADLELGGRLGGRDPRGSAAPPW